MIPLSELILEYICPIAGGLTATIMFAAPLPDAARAVQRRHLGALNPLPWAFMLGNCYGWVLYGVNQRNFFVYCANVPGFMLAVWLNLQAVKLQYTQSSYSVIRKTTTTTELEEAVHRDDRDDNNSKHVDDEKQQQQQQQQHSPMMTAPTQDTWILFMVLLWLLVTSVIGFQQNTITPGQQQLMIGLTVNLNLVVFYAAPLSTIWHVLHTQSSASIHVPTMLTNTANGVFWCAYGLAVQDWFIAVPNGMGAGLGMVQVVLRGVFPVQPRAGVQDVVVVDDSKRTTMTSVELLQDGSHL